MEKHHLQGGDKSSIRIGAYFQNELVSIMTFGKNRIALGNKSKQNEYEMYRFCVGNYNVIGIGGKLLSFFIKSYLPEKITSYADRRWSNINAFYNKINFSFDKYTLPNYWYTDGSLRFYRFNFRKDQLSKKLPIFDPNLSEWENMKNNGFDRIWDCGNLKYVWERPQV